MKRFVAWLALGLGLALGAGMVYAFYISEAIRLVTVGVGAFLLAMLTIGGTALMVNRQWTRALGSQSHRTVHNHRYPTYGSPQPAIWDGATPLQTPELWPPTPPALEGGGENGPDIDDEVVA